MADEAGTLSILIDIRARLDALAAGQTQMAGLVDKTRQATEQANKLESAFKTGLGIEVARRGIDLLTRTFHESVSEAFRLAGAIKDQSENLEISTEAYQVLGAVLKDAGGSMELLTQAISINNRSLAEARTLTSGAAAAYRQLGLDSSQLESMTVEQRMETIGRAILTAKDQTLAFGAASQILGSRNLPTLLGALRNLAGEGYGQLANAAKAAGIVMGDETVRALDRAQKQIEKFKTALAIQTGGLISQALGSDPMALQDLTQGIGAGLNFVRMATRSTGALFGNIGNVLAGREPVSFDSIAAQQRQADQEADRKTEERRAAQKKADAETGSALASKELKTQNLLAQIALIDQKMGAITSDPLRTETEQRERLLPLLNQQIRAYKELADLRFPDSTNLVVKAWTGTLSPEELERFKEYVDLLQRTEGARNSATSAAGVGVSDFKHISQRFWQFASGKNEQGGESLPASQGAGVGAMDWSMSLGSKGEQVAGAMNSTLGATVKGIGDGIWSWVTGVGSAGDAIRTLEATVARTLLDTIVQMGVQWIINGALAKGSLLSTFLIAAGLRKAETADVIANETAKTPSIMTNAAGSSVSSFGLAAVLGIAALLAVMAAFGGFRAGGGPVDSSHSYVVGERGPEIFTPGAAGTIIPNSAALEALALPPAARASAVSAGTLSVSSAFGGAGTGSGAQKRERMIAIVPDLNSARALQRDPNFESVIVDVVQRRRGEILG